METWDDWTNRSGFESKIKWEGEDVDDDVIDSWDQDEEEVGGKSLTEKSSGGKKLEQGDKKKADKTSTEETQFTEDPLAMKLEAKRLQEESDLVLAKEVFGVREDEPILESQKALEIVKNRLLGSITSHEMTKSEHYAKFTEEVVYSLCQNLKSSDLKKICIKLNNLHIQKTANEKGEKKKTSSKTKVKAKLRVDYEMDFGREPYDELLDDFI